MKGVLYLILSCLLFAGGALVGVSAIQPTIVNLPEIMVANDTLVENNTIINVETPYDRIPEDKIHVYKDRVVLDIPNAKWARFKDTNSMVPVLDIGTNAIQGTPENTRDIHVGDIISFDRGDDIIIHRVIETGYDSEGWYAITQGDNNSVSDGKVRFKNITSILLAIIY